MRDKIFCDFQLDSAHTFTGKVKLFLRGLVDPSKMIMLYYRVGNMAHKRNFKIIEKMCWLHIYHKYNCQISMSAEIGRNCYMGHPIGIVIGEDVKIGNDVIIFQGVTIGKKSIEIGGYPNIGNNCIIYASAKLLGNIKVKDGTIVGVNSVLFSDTEEGGIYVGVPAKNIKN